MPQLVPPVPQGVDFEDETVVQFLEQLRRNANTPNFYSLNVDPGLANVPSGTWSIWLNTTSGVLKLWANQGGTMKSVTLT